jgi:hypothetical protein
MVHGCYSVEEYPTECRLLECMSTNYVYILLAECIHSTAGTLLSGDLEILHHATVATAHFI